MKATDLDFSTDLKLDATRGIATFHDTRLVMFATEAIGLLRQSLTEELGWDKAREIFLRFGYQNGYADFLQMEVNYHFDTEMDLLAAGPVVHGWEGIVQASPRELAFDRDAGTFRFTGAWVNSYEAEQYLSFNQPADDPVCWTLMGYASGYATAFFGKPLVATEPVCVGCGDEHCEWLIEPPSQLGAAGTANAAALEKFWR
jgi:hypothetical protein